MKSLMLDRGSAPRTCTLLRRPWAGALVVAGLLAAGVGDARAQTGVWAKTDGAYWNDAASWSNSVIPNGVGHWAWLTGNNDIGGGIGGAAIITQNVNVTLGFLIFGDTDRGTASSIRGTNATTSSTLTFDTGDGRMALLSHGSGDLHTLGQPSGRNFNIGNGGDFIDVGIKVTDPQGLYIENFANLTFWGGTTNSRVFDGGGFDVIKTEDALLQFRRTITNVNNFIVRDAYAELILEGDLGMRPDITNIVIGVAPGTLETGALHPIQSQVLTGEGGAKDRTQYPFFNLIGDNNTNSTTKMTNTFNVVLNHGAYRAFSRPLAAAAQQSNWTNYQGVYSGTFTLNGTADESFLWTEAQDTGSFTSSARQVYFTGPLTGTGGFTKVGSGEMTLLGTNSFSGEVNLLRAWDRGRGRYGSIGLRDGGIMTAVAGFNILRDGGIYLDNSAVNIADRINDNAWILNQNYGRLEILGNGLAASSETLGNVTNRSGWMAFELDTHDSTPQAMTLNLARLVRDVGSVVSFHASDVRQGAFATNAGPGMLTVNLADNGASLTRIGGNGGVGAVNRKVVVGVFGGDASDIAALTGTTTDPNGIVANRADEFMTLDGGRLRTLRDDEMVHLGGRVTNTLTITQADAATDANVNIAFRSTQVAVNSSANGVGGALNLIKNRISGDVTWNSLRFGPATNFTGAAANDVGGRTILIDHGSKVTLESGMLLFGRDTRSATGDDLPGGSIYLWRGTLDLDGAANDREAVIHNSGGYTAVIRSTVEAANGLTKSGDNSIYLDKANAIGGTVFVPQSLLYLRDPAALGSATQVVISGSGELRLQLGGSFNPAELVVQPMPYAKGFLRSENYHNQWNGNIRIFHVDETGLTHHDTQFLAGENSQNATLTIAGDIALDGPQAASDIHLIDPTRLTLGTSAGILNLKGSVGDVYSNGVARPFISAAATAGMVGGGDITNRVSTENSVLRFRIDGPSLANYGDELAVNIYSPWRATGRLYAEQGTIRYLGDPAAGKGAFWDAQTLSNANFVNALSGFVLGEAGTDNGGSVTFLLTKDGQSLNAERFAIGNNNPTNTIALGLEHFGPQNKTVLVGNSYNDPSPAGDDNRITFDRELRVYSHNGWDSAAGTASVGRVNITQSLRGNGNATLTKIGSGVVNLQGPDTSAYSEANRIYRFVLLGGELVLDRSPGSSANLGMRRTTDDQTAALVLGGGDLTHWGNAAITTELLGSNLLVRAGDSIIRSRTTGPAGTNALFIATATAQTVTRQPGGTVNFERDLSAGGNAGIHFGLTANARIGSWAVISSNGLSGFSWAATDAGTNVRPFTAYSVDTFGSGNHVDVQAPSVFAADTVAASARFNANQGLDLGGFQLDVQQGGLLVTPNVGSTLSIGNGTLTGSGGELILHNYSAAYGFGISANITGALALTHSGPGTTTLTGANSFQGPVYLNGGTLRVDGAARLGNATNSLELRGGVLQFTGTTDLGTRSIVVGGDGGQIRVDAGMTVTNFGRIDSETNYLDIARVNLGQGDYIKSGLGTQVWAGAVADGGVVISNWIQGAIDIREGVVKVDRRFLTNEVFGTSRSYFDGTVIRSGAALVINSQTNAGNATPDIREWLTLEQGATLAILDRDPNFQGRRWNAPVNVLGDATVFVGAEDFSLHESAGYLEGPGSLIKTGDGALLIRNYSPDHTGALEVRDGTIDMFTTGPYTHPNASAIRIGSATNVDFGTLMFRIRPEIENLAKETVVPQNITVLGESADTRLGFFRSDHNDSVRFTGGIDLTGFNTNAGAAVREFQLWRGDDAVGQRTAEGGDTFDERLFVWLEGGITGGDKRIRTVTELAGNQDKGTQDPPELNVHTVYTLSGTNTGWTGTLEVGNRNGTAAGVQGPDFDKEHYVRFGRNDGAATLAISSNNIVVLRHDAHLQAFGSQVTIGTLMTDGKADNVTTDYYGNDPSTNSFIENAGTIAGSFRIVQQTNSILRATIRNGTFWSPTAGDQAAAPLSIIKDGPASLTLESAHTYSGTTRVMAGTLALTGGASIVNSSMIQIDAGATFSVTQRTGATMTLVSGQTLKGEGTYAGGLIVASNATVAPGSSPGTLTTTADVEFQSGSTFSVDLVGTLAGEADKLVMAGAGDTLTLGGATLSLITPNVLPVSSSFVIIDGFSSISGTFAGLPNDGDTVATANNTFEIQYNANDITLTVVPEPASLGLIGVAGLFGWLVRRRRC